MTQTFPPHPKSRQKGQSSMESSNSSTDSQHNTWRMNSSLSRRSRPFAPSPQWPSLYLAHNFTPIKQHFVPLAKSILGLLLGLNLCMERRKVAKPGRVCLCGGRFNPASGSQPKLQGIMPTPYGHLLCRRRRRISTRIKATTSSTESPTPITTPRICGKETESNCCVACRKHFRCSGPTHPSTFLEETVLASSSSCAKIQHILNLDGLKQPKGQKGFQAWLVLWMEAKTHCMHLPLVVTRRCKRRSKLLLLPQDQATSFTFEFFFLLPLAEHYLQTTCQATSCSTSRELKRSGTIHALKRGLDPRQKRKQDQAYLWGQRIPEGLKLGQGTGSQLGGRGHALHAEGSRFRFNLWHGSVRLTEKA